MIKRREIVFLEYSLFRNLGAQGIQCALNHFLTKFILFFPRKIGIAGGIRNCRSRQDSVRTNCLGNRNDRTNMDAGNAKALDRLSHRCTATRTGTSVGGQNCCTNAVTDHISCNFGSKLFGTADSSGITNRRIKIIIQFANTAFPLDLTKGIQG